MNLFSDSESKCENAPPEITESANNILESLLPKKSKNEYEKYYKLFMDWKQTIKKTDSFSENILIAFFGELSEKWKSSTMWKIYSILKATINVKHDIDISRYKKLKAFLKRCSDTYSAKKSKVFTAENVQQFLQNAPDNIYLATKVGLVIGVMGACRKNELYNLKFSNIKDLGTAFLISIPNTKSKKPREFTVTGEFYNIVKKYCHLRPRDILSDNFFVNFQKGKCTKQVIGINKIGNMPKQIATFLNLEKPQEYTGHCYRRTSATVLVDAGADMETLKRREERKSSQVAEGYIENSVQNRINIANKLVSSITGSNTPLIMPSTSNYVTVSSSSTNHHAIVENSSNNALVFHFENCTNITITTK